MNTSIEARLKHAAKRRRQAADQLAASTDAMMSVVAEAREQGSTLEQIAAIVQLSKQRVGKLIQAHTTEDR